MRIWIFSCNLPQELLIVDSIVNIFIDFIDCIQIIEQVHVGHSSNSSGYPVHRLFLHARESPLADQQGQVPNNWINQQQFDWILIDLYLHLIRVEEGKKVLQRIRGRFYNIDDEFQSIQSSEKETKRELQVVDTSKMRRRQSVLRSDNFPP